MDKMCVRLDAFVKVISCGTNTNFKHMRNIRNKLDYYQCSFWMNYEVTNHEVTSCDVT